MSKKEIMEILQLNGKDKKNKIVLILIASLLAMAAAVYSVFHIRKSDKTDGEKSVKARRQSKTSRKVSSKKRRAQAVAKKATSVQSKTAADETEHTITATVQQPAAPVPKQVYIVRPLPKEKQESKARRFKRHMCAAVAAILVLSLVGSGMMNYIQPATVMAAKGSFSGIGKIVAEHSEDNPYVILDIVPTEAIYTDQGVDYAFSTGTMGYLVSGQAAIVQDIQNHLQNNSAFYDYDTRQKMLSAVTNDGNGFPEVSYREAYAGIDNVSSGWIPMFDNIDPESPSGSTTARGELLSYTGPTGVFTGRVTKMEGGNYDLVYITEGGAFDGLQTASLLGGEFYQFNQSSGKYQVLFGAKEASDETEGGYVVKETIDPGSATDATYVYLLNEYGVYEYWGTVETWNAMIKDAQEAYENENIIKKGEVVEEEEEEEEKEEEPDEEEEDPDEDGEGDEDKTTPPDDTTPPEGETQTPPGEETETTPGEETETTPGGESETTPGGESETTPGGESETTPGGETETTPGGESETTPGGESETIPGGESETIPGGETQTPPEDTPPISEGVESPTNAMFSNDGAADVGYVPSVKNIPFSNRWYKLVAEGADASATQENSAVLENTTTPEAPETPITSDVPAVSEAPTTQETPTTSETPTYTEDVGSQGEIDWDDFWSRYANYRVVVFEYVPEPVEGQQLYEYKSVSDLESEESGDIRPYDTYDWSGIEEDVTGNEDGIETYGFATEFPVLATGSSVDGVFCYVGEGLGQYQLERISGGSISIDESGNSSNIGVIKVQNASVYYRCSTSKDWLKEYVFGTLSGGDNANDSFAIEVRTVRADEVTPVMVYEADLVYLECGGGNTVLSNDLTFADFNADGEDMPDLAAAEILRRVTQDLMPVIVDYDIVNIDKYNLTNYQFLARALMKRDVSGFYDAVNGSDLMANLRLGINDERYPEKTDNNYNYVNQNIYVANADTALVSEDFPNNFGDFETRAGFSDVMAAIKAENTMLAEEDKLSETVSKARAVQYIINFSVGIVGELGDLRILELQPTANDVSDLDMVYSGDGGAKLVWKKPPMTTAKQILNSKNVFNIIQKDVKSVAEFNSEWEDINGVYDFVFIGLDGRKLNVDDEGNAVYNDSSLNGRVYQTADSPYDANDLTAQKMTDLLEYMEAGYPVIVEDDCFKDGSAQKAEPGDVSTEYIGQDTIMYRFLNAAITDDRYKDFIYTVSDAMAGAMFMTQVRVAKPRISLRSEGDIDEAAIKYVTKDANSDEYHGRIAYEITSSKSDGDNYEAYPSDTVVRFYADLNYDGIYSDDEEVTDYTIEGNVLDVEISGMGPGILPWKLEVSDSGNPKRRDSVLGYFEIASSAKGELNVLQIVSDTGNEETNLQTMFHKSTNSMLANRLLNAESTLNADMLFETITPDELAISLGENESYLEQWDIVVLTLEGLNLGDTVTYINQYVSEGRSLLVCGSAYTGENRAGLDNVLLGQTEDDNGNTYAWMGRNGRISGYHRYAGLDAGGMYDTVRGLRADVVNEGSIAHYPYEIEGGSFTVGESVDVSASPYQLDFSGNFKTDEYVTYVTPWYALGGSNTAYGVSPKDGRNNYYCYSKGNVVYLAQSGYPYTLDSDAGDGECKFFVNALVAAYSAGVHKANVNIVAGFSPDSVEVESIAVPFDDVWLEANDSTNGILDNTVDVYFRFRDSNIAMNKTVAVEFLREDTAEGTQELPVGGKKVKAVDFESPIWMVENNRLTLVEKDQLEPGKTYRIKAPVVTLQNDTVTNKADIYIVIQTSFIRNGREYSIISSDSVSLNRAQLFELE